jgi:hypothetical protein
MRARPRKVRVTAAPNNMPGSAADEPRTYRKDYMMKKITTRIATVLLLSLVCVAPAFAKVKSRTITVGQDFAVGATAVKAGTYRFSFDDQKNELTVLDRKSKEVIARAEARAETRADGLLTMQLNLVGGSGSKTLASISFDGEKQSYVLAGSTAAR